MSYEDLDAARGYYHAIRGLIIHHAGGWRDEIVLRKLHFACRAAAAALADRQCRVQLGAIEDYARQLYSDAAHVKWARGQTSGADYLRLQILRELDVFHARLGEIETMRDAHAWPRIDSSLEKPGE